MIGFCEYRKQIERVLFEYRFKYIPLPMSELRKIFCINDLNEDVDQDLAYYQAKTIKIYNEILRKIQVGKFKQYNDGFLIEVDNLKIYVYIDETNTTMAASYNYEDGNTINVYTDNLFDLVNEPLKYSLFHEIVHYLRLYNDTLETRINKTKNIDNINAPYENNEEKQAYINELVFYLSDTLIKLYLNLDIKNKKQLLNNRIKQFIYDSIKEIITRSDHSFSDFLHSLSEEELNNILEEITEYMTKYIGSQLKEDSFSLWAYDYFKEILNS